MCGPNEIVCPNCGSANSARRPLMTGQRSASVASLLQSNEPLTAVEAGRIRKTLADAQSSLASVEARIAGLQKERTILEKVIEEHKVVLSPLRSLATEILSEILLFSAGLPTTLNTKSGAWTLSKVSHRWRDIVVSLPQFWSSVSIFHQSKVPRCALSIVHTILCRSGDATLDITFEVPSRDPADIRAWGALLDLLASASLRWRAIKFTGAFSLTEYLSQVRGHVPRLEKLSLHIKDKDHWHVPEEMGLWDLWYDAPRLRRVEWVAPSNSDLARVIPLKLPWPQITRFDTGVVGPIGLNVLGSASHLTHLTLNALEYAYDPLGHTILLNGLRHLHLHWAAHILMHFALPVLDNLTFEQGSCDDLVEYLSPLLTRSECRLTRLILNYPDVPVDDATALSLYRLVPSLVELELNLTHVHSTFSLITTLKYDQDDDGPSIPLPGLKILKIDIRYQPVLSLVQCYSLSVSSIEFSSFFDAIKDAIVSRTAEFVGTSQRITPLQSLEFVCIDLDKACMVTLENLDRLRTMAS